MHKEEVCTKIREVGIVPAVRTSSTDDARFAAEAVAKSGIPIVEITMTVPGAVDVISHLVKNLPDVIVGAGTLLDVDTARVCVAAGVRFLTSPGLDLEIVSFAARERMCVMAGALTPTEVITAWKAGSDFVKVFPCAQVGGDSYIRALRGPLPRVPLIAAGGVNQQTAANFILAGADAIGIGRELIPKEALQQHQEGRISELARRFLGYVKSARSQRAASLERPTRAREPGQKS
ncbi:MAG TPA: bifunctional 4-hydroxy-2-oxoglutarate aldolase/2-dehydro-3-deoxy-phosphogluconate aldolase [Candidatus Polarisedimenticolia bacterium]|nr:bifunctional 4-hydroxy-2-oxoglutarate aldolase/2-dehydro-3-deoxy-phosphogluconate aldolase [Candidatus Polarisedimenticolia bacterium]